MAHLLHCIRVRAFTISPSYTTFTTKIAPSADPTTTPPVFWTEVFSRPDARWIPVDPIRCIINKPKAFDPSGPSAGGSTSHRPTDNRMVYVLAFKEDSYARDVTSRYAREYGAKVAKVQLGGGSGRRGGAAKEVWWEMILGVITRPYRLASDLRLFFFQNYFNLLIPNSIETTWRMRSWRLAS